MLFLPLHKTVISARMLLIRAEITVGARSAQVFAMPCIRVDLHYPCIEPGLRSDGAPWPYENTQAFCSFVGLMISSG